MRSAGASCPVAGSVTKAETSRRTRSPGRYSGASSPSYASRTGFLTCFTSNLTCRRGKRNTKRSAAASKSPLERSMKSVTRRTPSATRGDEERALSSSAAVKSSVPFIACIAPNGFATRRCSRLKIPIHARPGLSRCTSARIASSL
eukprot:scaffold57_cov254-Pinguiococcus_pyrenoidosus.AAC.48